MTAGCLALEAHDDLAPISDSSRSTHRPTTIARDGGPPASAAELAWVGALIDAIPEYVLLVNEDHRILLTNAALRRDLCLSAEALDGGYCPRVIHGLETPFPGCPLEKAVLAGGGQADSELFDPATGRWTRASILPTSFRDQDGRAVFLHVVGDITTQKQLEMERSGLLVEVMTSQDAERRRIARELHDDTAQSLASVLMRLQRLEGAGGADAAGLAELRQQVERIVDDIRRLARGLHPSLLDDLGLPAALERHIADYVHAHGIEVDLHISGLAPKVRLPRPVEVSLYRIAQEALTNVARHSGANHASVLLERRGDELQLIVEDDGCGIPDDHRSLASRGGSPKLGLTGVRERVALLCGEVTIEARPEGGTTLYVKLPMEGRP